MHIYKYNLLLTVIINFFIFIIIMVEEGKEHSSKLYTMNLGGRQLTAGVLSRE